MKVFTTRKFVITMIITLILLAIITWISFAMGRI